MKYILFAAEMLSFAALCFCIYRDLKRASFGRSWWEFSAVLSGLACIGFGAWYSLLFGKVCT